MNEIKVAAESLSALFEHNWHRLMTLATCLWHQGTKPVTIVYLARSCLVVKPEQAVLVYRLLIRGRALHEWPAREEAEVIMGGLITLMIEINQLIQPQLSSSSSHSVELVWTLPAGLNLPAHLRPQRSILDLILAVIASAQERLWLVSPFINEAGLEQLFEPTLSALRRGVRLVVITQDLQDLSSPNSRAIERLHREATALGSDFQAYTFHKEAEGDEWSPPLLHAKIVMADSKLGYLGTANLTGHGLRSNLEIGLRLNEPEAQEVESLLLALISSTLVKKTLGS